jgi:hypothetical protein
MIGSSKKKRKVGYEFTFIVFADFSRAPSHPSATLSPNEGAMSLNTS